MATYIRFNESILVFRGQRFFIVLSILSPVKLKTTTGDGCGMLIRLRSSLELDDAKMSQQGERRLCEREQSCDIRADAVCDSGTLFWFAIVLARCVLRITLICHGNLNHGVREEGSQKRLSSPFPDPSHASST